MAWIT